MLTVETKQKLTALVIFVLPVGIIVGTGAYFGGPAPVSAGVGLAPVVAPGTNGTTENPAIEEFGPVIEHIAWLNTQEFAASPLYYASKNEVIVVDDTPADDSVPSLMIKMIMASSGGNKALINGQTYEVGQMFSNTKWKITEIDSRNRSVTIQDTLSDRVHTQSQ